MRTATFNSDKGYFITFEGLKRTGKSTQLALLDRALTHEGYKVKTLHTSLLNGKDVTFMRATPETRFFLYLAALSEATEQIHQYMEQDYIVLADRYVHSQFAYSSLDPTPWRHPSTINQLYLDWYGQRPDLVIYTYGQLFGEDGLDLNARQIVAASFQRHLPTDALQISNEMSAEEMHAILLRNTLTKLKSHHTLGDKNADDRRTADARQN